MSVEKIAKNYDFYELVWDTDFFGITCAKVMLNKPLIQEEWISLKKEFNNYQFISIVNKYSEPGNARIIGKGTTAFLTDVNIQFLKQIEAPFKNSPDISIQHSLNEDETILELAQFPYSKFTDDPELLKRGGDQVYKKWIQSAFNQSNKFFALSKNVAGNITGFLLHSYSGNACVLELMAISSKEAGGGIGVALYKAVESSAHQLGCNEIKVGTQVRNATAINFYRKLGFKQIGAHQVYHLWNL